MVKLTSKSQADMHFAGSKHRRALAVKSGNGVGGGLGTVLLS